jgi:26S proteasome regulatory subunit N9
LLIDLYEQFVSDWQSKMNRISLVKFVTRTSTQFSNPTKALEFLNPFIEKFKEDKNGQDAYAFVLAESCLYKLALSQLDECKDRLKLCESLLETIAHCDAIIHTTFYRINAEYYKV